MFQHWGKQLEIRYLVSDRGQIFKIKMWGKGREGDRGREREWVCSMYVRMMYVCIYVYYKSVKQSNEKFDKMCNLPSHWNPCSGVSTRAEKPAQWPTQTIPSSKQQRAALLWVLGYVMTLSTFLHWRLVLLLLVQTLRKGLHSIRLALLSKETKTFKLGSETSM